MARFGAKLTWERVDYLYLRSNCLGVEFIWGQLLSWDDLVWGRCDCHPLSLLFYIVYGLTSGTGSVIKEL